ncbi:MAG: hypothetical protein R2856_26365 [Caldilineaceae bacterium]
MSNWIDAQQATIALRVADFADGDAEVQHGVAGPAALLLVVARRGPAAPAHIANRRKPR